MKILLMEENRANHLGCIKPCKEWDKVPTSTGESRISSINSSSMSGNLIFLGLPKKCTYPCTIRILRCCDGGCCNGKRQIHVGSTLFGTAMSRGSETNDEFSGKGWRSNTNERAALLSESSIYGMGCSSRFFNLLYGSGWCYSAAVLFSLRLAFLDVLVPVPFLCQFSWHCKFHSSWLPCLFSPSLCIEILQRTYFQPRLRFFCTFYVLKPICNSFTLFWDSHDIFDSWVTSARKENRGCRIVVTQPRRIAAKGLATRVSQQAEGSSWKVLHGIWSIINWYFWIFFGWNPNSFQNGCNLIKVTW